MKTMVGDLEESEEYVTSEDDRQGLPVGPESTLRDLWGEARQRLEVSRRKAERPPSDRSRRFLLD